MDDCDHNDARPFRSDADSMRMYRPVLSKNRMDDNFDDRKNQEIFLTENRPPSPSSGVEAHGEAAAMSVMAATVCRHSSAK